MRLGKDSLCFHPDMEANMKLTLIWRQNIMSSNGWFFFNDYNAHIFEYSLNHYKKTTTVESYKVVLL